MSEQTVNSNKGRLTRTQKTKRVHDRLLSKVFLAFLGLCLLLNLIVKDRTYSAEENRNLAQFPAFSPGALYDGSFFEDLESYVADQFFARDLWISLKMTEDKVLGKKESGDVFLGKKGYLLSKPNVTSSEVLTQDIELINLFAQKYDSVSMTMMVVPGAALITPQHLPANAQVYDQLGDIERLYGQVSSNVTCIDAAAVLSAHSEEYIYYKTDHHWTSLGAMYAFEALRQPLGLPASQTYNVYPVSTDFQGTLSSRSGSHTSRDQVDIYVNTEEDVNYYVSYISTGEKTTSIYKSSALETKDKYTVFLGGNYPILEINTDCLNGRTLLIFKDSYANSLIQFLYPYFQRIVLVDPRYYYDNINATMTGKGVTDVLFLYSADTFLTDTGLSDVLASALDDSDELEPLPDSGSEDEISTEADISTESGE